MSDSTEFELSLIHPSDVDAFVRFATEVKAIQKTAGMTRGGFFLNANDQLLRDFGLPDTIGFLSGQRSTFSRIVRWNDGVETDATNSYEVIPWKLNAECGSLNEYTTLLPSDLNDVKRHIDELWELCVKNVDTHDLLADYAYCDTSEQLFGDMKFFKWLNDCPWGDDGDGSAFYFFALYAIRTLIHEALERNLVAIYRNSYWVTIAEIDKNGSASAAV